ncbi:hypothetical protein ACP70R_008851 [Stipagrostis hirtigluma subsp. patula]
MVMVTTDSPSEMVPELDLLRSGKWRVRRPQVSHDDGTDLNPVMCSWRTHTAVPVGDRLLCWADMSQGLIFSDVFDESPGLRYMPLPPEMRFSYMSVTADGVVKLVRFSNCCSCGRGCATSCPRSPPHAYTIKTWMLRMDDMVWVMDGMVDATELWALDAYEGLPRVPLAHPVVSMDDPHTICFVLCEEYFRQDGDNTEQIIMVDLRSKTLLSVYRYPEGQSYDH